MGTLSRQIQGLLAATVILTAMIILGAAWINTSNYTAAQIAREFKVGTESFEGLLRSRETSLRTSAQLIASDFGFKQTIATSDSATINSVLSNHRRRVNADLMFLTDLDGLLLNTTTEGSVGKDRIEDQGILSEAQQRGSATAFVVLQQRIFQVIVVPVKAPVTIAFAGFGFELNLDIAQQIKAITALDVTFQAQAATDRTVSTLASDRLAQAANSRGSIDGVFGLISISNNPYVSKRITLNDAGGTSVTVLLSADLTPYYSDFARLRNDIGLIVGVVLILALAASAFLARDITIPLRQLAAASNRIAKGDYSTEERRRTGLKELDTLADAMTQMSTDIRQRERHILFQAQHDHLTGLLNRNTLTERLRQRIDGRETAALIVALNLRDFKSINDVFGPKIGDLCLIGIAERLRNFSTGDPQVGRFGGDEFVIYMPVDRDDLPLKAVSLLLTHLKAPLEVSEITLSLDFYAGYVTTPEGGATADELLTHASIALERARRNKLEVRAYQPGEEEDHLRSLMLLNDLERTLNADDDQLSMYYQPKKHLRRGRVEKLEALIRWEHPTEGSISPELFIGLAEQSSLMPLLTGWVIQTVLEQMSQWHQILPEIQVAVNIASQDLEREDLLDTTQALLKRLGLPASMLCLEMTERDMMEDPERAMIMMHRISAAGIELSVDDYGVGQSSLSRLRQMPIQEIKIDKQFIKNLATSPEDQTIVRSTIDLGHNFGLRVIAEGVENAATEALLASYGCDFIQGYYLSRPLKADAVIPWIESQQTIEA